MINPQPIRSPVLIVGVVLIALAFVVGALWLFSRAAISGSSADGPGSAPSCPQGKAPTSAEWARILKVESQTRQLRGLRQRRSVQIAFLPNPAFNCEVSSGPSSRRTRRAMHTERQALVLLGLAPPSYNLKSGQKGMANQVVGLYNWHTKKFYIRATGHALGYDRWTIAHEYTHALQDQRFDLSHVIPEGHHKRGYANSDAQLAAQSVVEGDATFLQNDYVQHFYSHGDIVALQKEIRSYPKPKVPSQVELSFTFPYTYGLQYVTHLIDDGGYHNVNLALRNPPRSTFAIMFPGRHVRADKMVIKGLAGRFRQWRVADDNVGGAFSYFQIADKFIGKSAGMKLAAAWRGDRYLILKSGKRVAIFLKSAYADSNRAQLAKSILARSLAGRFHQHDHGMVGGVWNGSRSSYAAVRSDGRFVDLAYAPSAGLARALAFAPTR